METLFIGRNIIFLPEVDSTNSYAINLLKNVNIAEGSVIYTGKQTKGRGQRGNEWYAEPESNLTVSIILKPAFLDLKKHFYLYQVAALACYDVMAELLGNSHFDISHTKSDSKYSGDNSEAKAVEPSTNSIKIKWPNDILVNEKKIAGILIENNVFNNSINQSVIGIGINVNQNKFESNINAISLKIISGKNYGLKDVLNLLCTRFEKHYLSLKNNNFQTISENYLKHFYKRDQWQDFEIDSKVQSMIVRGVSNNGLLFLENKNGDTKEFDVKEAKWML